jgi:ABC-type cobalamin/Fe3+-siderophores transport system ATPase subunit
MQVSRIVIKNILGISDLEISPGSITQIHGGNGAGKTSVLEAIRCALSGGTDATLLKSGAESGEVVLVLDDGTSITRRITADSSNVSVVHPEFGRLTKPAQYLKKLADALSLNPVQFLSAPKKDRVDQLLQAIPMQVTAEQLGFVPQVALNGVNLDEHALEVIGKIQKSIYDLRTGVNRSQKDKEATARQMTETLPPEAPEGDWNATYTNVSDRLRELTGETSERVGKAKRAAADQISALKDAHSKHKEAVNAELEAQIEKLRADSAIQIQGSEKERDTKIGIVEENREEYLASLKADYDPQHKELSESLAQAKAMIEQHAKAESTREFIAKLTKDADGLDVESTKLTHAMGRLEILKASLLEKLPIEGLSVTDGDIFVGGISFDRVNESKRIRLAIEIAKLRAGSLGLVAVDGLERLDPKTFEAFKKEAAKSKLQFVISRVTDGPLAITTEGQVA